MQLYKVGILCLEGFWLKEKQNIISGSLLSQLLCNIYLHELDIFIMTDFVKKYIKKGKLCIYNSSEAFYRLKEYKKRVPFHIQKQRLQLRQRCFVKK